jgi:uncharacterized protein with ParB-like and HNH nuclease domain
MSISASQRENIGSIFNGNLFVIPSYQRKYSWSNKERMELWNDIKEAKANSINHFFGTLIFKQTENENLDEVYEIIDGQQRTTTIFLLLNELIERIEDSKKRASYKSKFIVDNGNIKLSPLGADKEFLKNLLLDSKCMVLNDLDKRSQKNLYNAKKQFQDLSSAFSGKEALEIIDFIRKNVEVLVLVVEKQSEAIRMFEIINDRGLELNYLDKVKSIAMLYSTMYLKENLNTVINDSFEIIFDSNDNIFLKRDKLKILARFDENETLFSHHYTKSRKFFPDTWNYRNGVKTIFESFKNRCEKLKNDSIELEKFLKSYIEDFSNFAKSYSNLIDSIDKSEAKIEAFQFLDFSATLYPLIVILYQQNKLEDLLEILVSVEVRVYKFKGTNPRADIPDLCNDISENEWTIEKIKAWLVWFRDKFMNDGNFEYYLDDSIYGNNAIKYILLKYKNNKVSFEEYQNLQIEHIFPEGGKNGVSFTVEEFEFKNIDDYNYTKNTIGNLILLEQGLNAGKEVSNLTPKEKVNGYLKSNIEETKQMAGTIDKDGFDKNKIESRTKDIIDFCLKQF